ncbi:MAG TPA: hypothetical protein VHZ76_04550 [Gammaproteobacteria bacterium]|jgi:hypothetical protein|nr:hypothetical protein [Gammaproteobacteria bacterium]
MNTLLKKILAFSACLFLLPTIATAATPNDSQATVRGTNFSFTNHTQTNVELLVGDNRGSNTTKIADIAVNQTSPIDGQTIDLMCRIVSSRPNVDSCFLQVRKPGSFDRSSLIGQILYASKEGILNAASATNYSVTFTKTAITYTEWLPQ